MRRMIRAFDRWLSDVEGVFLFSQDPQELIRLRWAQLDRDISFGYEGAVGSDIKAALASAGSCPKVINFIAGIAGRDITKENIEGMYDKLFCFAQGKEEKEMQFIGLRW